MSYDHKGVEAMRVRQRESAKRDAERAKFKKEHGYDMPIVPHTLRSVGERLAVLMADDVKDYQEKL